MVLIYKKAKNKKKIRDFSLQVNYLSAKVGTNFADKQRSLVWSAFIYTQCILRHRQGQVLIIPSLGHANLCALATMAYPHPLPNFTVTT
jgi:hypothetical protein